MHMHRAKIDSKNCKVSLRDEKRSYTCFNGQGIDKPYSLRSVMKASRLLCQASIIYWRIPTTSRLYLSTFVVYELSDVVCVKLS